MRYIKTYEELNDGEPEIGDYVLMKSPPGSGIPECYSVNIGEITDILKSNQHDTLVTIEYDNNDIKPLIYYHISWIKYWTKNKEELNILLNQSKYNL